MFVYKKSTVVLDVYIYFSIARILPENTLAVFSVYV